MQRGLIFCTVSTDNVTFFSSFFFNGARPSLVLYIGFHFFCLRPVLLPDEVNWKKMRRMDSLVQRAGKWQRGEKKNDNDEDVLRILIRKDVWLLEGGEEEEQLRYMFYRPTRTFFSRVRATDWHDGWHFLHLARSYSISLCRILLSVYRNLVEYCW